MRLIFILPFIWLLLHYLGGEEESAFITNTPSGPMIISILMSIYQILIVLYFLEYPKQVLYRVQQENPHETDFRRNK